MRVRVQVRLKVPACYPCHCLGGVLGLFLIVALVLVPCHRQCLSSSTHPTLPNLQAGACSSGSGWRVLSSWFASLSPIVSFCHCSIVGPLSPRSFLPSHCFVLHLFPPHEQLLAPVVLGAGVVVVVVPASLWFWGCPVVIVVSSTI